PPAASSSSSPRSIIGYVRDRFTDKSGDGPREQPKHEELSHMPYKVVPRSAGGGGGRGRFHVNWEEVEAASAAGGSVEIPLDGTLNSTAHAAVHHGAANRGRKAHVKTIRDTQHRPVALEV